VCEIEAARKLLLDPAVRLLTLVGPPGVGKTRLALQLAWEVASAFADGACFVELAAISDPALVASTLIQALGVVKTANRGGDAETALLREHLRNRQMLLVFDNFEQLLPAAPLVADLLAAAPNVKVLVTSRATLRVYGEHEFSVPPLELPDLARLPALDGLAQLPSVALFVARARASRPDFALTPANGLAIAAICVRLDGLPLAIELAAAQSKLFEPQRLAAQLVGGHPRNREDTTGLRMLARGPRNAPIRQQTLAGAIDWSYNLLDPDEQALFARLGVFVGGWTLEAATAAMSSKFRVISEEAHQLNTQNSELKTLEGLASLVDKSMVVRREQGPGLSQDESGELRFTMLEMLREYALERLAAHADEEERLRKHIQIYL
jgi:predicted ATPase